MKVSFQNARMTLSSRSAREDYRIWILHTGNGGRLWITLRKGSNSTTVLQRCFMVSKPLADSSLTVDELMSGKRCSLSSIMSANVGVDNYRHNSNNK